MTTTLSSAALATHMLEAPASIADGASPTRIGRPITRAPGPGSGDRAARVRPLGLVVPDDKHHGARDERPDGGREQRRRPAAAPGPAGGGVEARVRAPLARLIGAGP